MEEEVGRNLILVLCKFNMTLFDVGSTLRSPLDSLKNLQAEFVLKQLCTPDVKTFLSLFFRVN